MTAAPSPPASPPLPNGLKEVRCWCRDISVARVGPLLMTQWLVCPGSLMVYTPVCTPAHRSRTTHSAHGCSPPICLPRPPRLSAFRCLQLHHPNQPAPDVHTCFAQCWCSCYTLCPHACPPAAAPQDSQHHAAHTFVLSPSPPLPPRSCTTLGAWRRLGSPWATSSSSQRAFLRT